MRKGLVLCALDTDLHLLQHVLNLKVSEHHITSNYFMNYPQFLLPETQSQQVPLFNK